MVLRGEVPVLFDDDILQRAVMSELVEVCRSALVAEARGELTAPARHSVGFDDGAIVFTAGGNEVLAGFRAYETFPTSAQHQVVAVWNRGSGRLTGVVVGEQLGAYRTGALGGVAVDVLSARGASTCAVIGTGLQATTQLLATAAVRRLDHVWCYSRSEEGRHSFAERMTAVLGIPVTAAPDARSAVADAQVVLLATRAREPVIAATDLLPDAHVSTVGPKGSMAYELPPDLVEGSWRIASDSPLQIRSQSSFFLTDESTLGRIEHLGTLEPLGENRGGRTCYLSAGLAGTEVLVAAHLLTATA